MKYYLILLIIIINYSCGYGQYPIHPKVKNNTHPLVYDSSIVLHGIITTPEYIWEHSHPYMATLPLYFVPNINFRDDIINTDTLKPQILYGYAGIKQEKQPFDSVKYWRKQFLLYQDKMQKSSGRAFARYEDSCTKFYKLLYKK